MKSMIYLSSKSLCRLFIILCSLLLLSTMPEQLDYLSGQNSNETSNVLIDFSTFQNNIKGYAYDKLSGYDYDDPNYVPPLSYNKTDVEHFGDPCRMEIIQLPVKYKSRKFELNQDCDLRLEEHLPHTPVWTDMHYPNWKGIFIGKRSDVGKFSIVTPPKMNAVTLPKDYVVDLGDDYPKLKLNDETMFLRIDAHFPNCPTPYQLEIKPKFPIYEYALDGQPINRVRQTHKDGNITQGEPVGIIDNIAQIKDIELDIIGTKPGDRVYVVLSNQKGDYIKHFMGWTMPLFSRGETSSKEKTFTPINSKYAYEPLKWSNSNYRKEKVNYVISPIPTKADELTYIKFHSIIIEPEANVGKSTSYLVKNIKLIYDLRFSEKKLSADIRNTNLWENIIAIGKEKREFYEKQAQPVINYDLEQCYISPNRNEDCIYSLYW
jgi:hypothetical protein